MLAFNRFLELFKSLKDSIQQLSFPLIKALVEGMSNTDISRHIYIYIYIPEKGGDESQPLS